MGVVVAAVAVCDLCAISSIYKSRTGLSLNVKHAPYTLINNMFKRSGCARRRRVIM